jgi:hypothetical protein
MTRATKRRFLVRENIEDSNAVRLLANLEPSWLGGQVALLRLGKRRQEPRPLLYCGGKYPLKNWTVAD